jgi:hypothetical protein
MRPITEKNIQVHQECICGYNTVYQDSFLIRWKDLHSCGIKRKKDRKTGEPFLLQHLYYDKCMCNDEE